MNHTEVVYKVSPPRTSLVFEPSVFYRTADFKSSSTQPKPGYIQDTLLYAGDEREISLHLLPSIYRVRVWLDDANRQRLVDLGFAPHPDKQVAIFVNEADQATISDFTPTVYRFDAADFERTPSNEFISRKPVRAIGAETLTMPDILRRWKIQVMAVPRVEDTEERLRQAGVECSSQSGRKWTLVFRTLTSAEEEAGYQIICDTVEWLRSKDIDLWRKPLPRETYAARHQRGENYGLFSDGQLAAIVSLVRGAAKQWAEELSDRQIMWMSTLTTANAFRGRGLGRQIVEQAISHLVDRGEKILYLDCKPGFLTEFYSGAGFEEVARKTATINRGAACYLAEVVLMRRAL
jgi:GNAT superfamily N-acetyltransferase